MTGAQAVESQITLTGSVGQRIEGAASRVGAKFERWTALLPLIPIAMGVLLVAIVLAWLVGRWAWPFRRVTSNPFLADIAQTLTQAAVVLTGVLLALEVLDATALVGGVLGAAGVAGIAIGFAFRDLVENYIASVLLSLRQPFRPRDHVVIDGKEGLVTSMNSRTTVLTSFDGNLVRIPNAVVFKTTLINYTSDPRRRFNFEVGVGYDVDLSQAVRVGVAVLKETEGVMADPEPFAMVTKLGDSSITVSIFGWVLQTTHDFGRVRGSAMQRVKAEFDRLDIDMPEPSYTVRLLPGHALAQGAQGLHAPTPEANGLADSGETRGHAQREAHPISPEPPGKPDVSADDTTVQLAEEAAHGTGGTNLLREDAPKE